MTNIERIKAMSVEEYVRQFHGTSLCSHIQDEDVSWCANRAVCTNCIKEWLESEVQDG